MLSKSQIIDLFYQLNSELSKRGIKGEVLMAGGASLSLVYDVRDSTKDIDALFEPAAEIRDIVASLARTNELEEDWLNDGVKGFIDTSKQETEIFLSLSNLVVRTIDAEGLLALKLASSRSESKDFADALVLTHYLEISSLDQLYELVERKIPSNQRTPRSNFFIQMVWSEYETSLQKPEVKETPADEIRDLKATKNGQVHTSRGAKAKDGRNAR